MSLDLSVETIGAPPQLESQSQVLDYRDLAIKLRHFMPISSICAAEKLIETLCAIISVEVGAGNKVSLLSLGTLSQEDSILLITPPPIEEPKSEIPEIHE